MIVFNEYFYLILDITVDAARKFQQNNKLTNF